MKKKLLEKIESATLDYLMAYYHTTIHTRPVMLLNSKMMNMLQNEIINKNNKNYFLDKIEVIEAEHLKDYEVEVH